jgi:Tol biopolymer transport system component
MPASSDLLERRIWVRDLGDDVPRQLTGDPLYRDESPFWSADGEQLFFLRMTRDGRVSLWVIATDGGAPRRLVDELTPAPDWFANEGAPDWAELFSWHPGA